MSEKLISRGRIIIIPDCIDTDCYSDFLLAVLKNLHTPVYVFIEGNGGDSSKGFAIADAIKMHGNVTGILTGSALSAHATVFASCQHRFVFPNAALGIHQCGWFGEMDIDANRLENLQTEFKRVDRNTAELMASICGVCADVWELRIKSVGNRDFFMISTNDILNVYGMAKSITELDTKWLTKALQLKKSRKVSPTTTSST